MAILEEVLKHFLHMSRDAFGYIVTELGFREVNTPDETFTCRWTDGRTIVKCQGIHWAEPRASRLARATMRCSICGG